MKIAVLVSGGVDSSVALMLLKQKGYDVTAFYLKIWLEDEISHLSDCPWEEDLLYVREICKKEQIPMHIINLQKEYFDTVVNYTLSEVKNGRTPNPDVMCNNRVKFGLFLEKIDEKSDEYGGPFDKIATGHYAQIEHKKGIFQLKTSKDPVKDQTYFLSYLSQDKLSRLMFPLGKYKKKKVRKLAKKFDLPNKDRKDSQGICFLGKFKYSEFIKHYLGVKKGDVIDFETGKKLGDHEGFWYYTIGQRKGIKLGGGPYFVVSKDIKNNIIFVSKKYFEKDKSRVNVEVENINWIAGAPPKSSIKLNKIRIKIRHGEKFHKCKKIEFKNESLGTNFNNSASTTVKNNSASTALKNNSARTTVKNNSARTALKKNEYERQTTANSGQSAKIILKNNEYESQTTANSGQSAKIILKNNEYERQTTANSGQSAKITLKKNDQGIASGQFVAFYYKKFCIGSGVIK